MQSLGSDDGNVVTAPAWGSSRRRAFAVPTLVALAAAATWPTWTDRDHTASPLDGVVRAVGAGAGALRWHWVVLVAVLAFAHYAAAALALRAASGLRLPLRESVLVQLAASAANRLTPAGIGGAGVNARYLTRRGLPGPSAIGAVAALAVLGAPADVMVLGAVAGAAMLLHLGVDQRQLSLVGRHLAHTVDVARQPWVWVVAGAVAALLLMASSVRRARARRRTTDRPRARLAGALLRLLRHPSQLAALLAASGGTTLVLAVAFAAATYSVPGHRTTASAALLVIGYMLASAAGAAIPTPSNIGSTEAALIVVLVGLGDTAPQAAAATMLFRVVTFWAPAAVGLLATRNLRRRAAL